MASAVQAAQSTTPIMQRTPFATQTASTEPAETARTEPAEVAAAPPPALVQEMLADDWQVKNQLTYPETAVVTPTMQSPSSTPSLMRAIAAAEKPPAHTAKETVQWPDIAPTATQNGIQRDMVETTNIDMQRVEAEPGIDDEESSDEESPEVDVDKLANEVYSQLRKRLAIEWERGRGKR